MFLPVFFIAGRGLYVTFNKNAYQSYSGNNEVTINYKYQSNEVNSNDDLIEGNIYKLSMYNEDLDEALSFATQSNFYLEFDLLDWNFTDFDDHYFDDFYTSSVSNPQPSQLTIDGTAYFSICYKSLPFGNLIDNFTIIYELYDLYDYQGCYVIFKFLSYGYVTSDFYNFVSYTDYNEIESVDIQQDTLDNAFTMSMNELNTNPLFSWAKDSFVKAPFTYITGLFGVQSDSPINSLFSYWASISVCWLVFDIIMYVPLLAHRWIDKAKVE